MIRRLLRHKQVLLRQMTTSVNAMVPHRLPRRLIKRLINFLGSTTMLTKGNVGVVKVRLTKLGNLTRRNIRRSRLILLLMRHPLRPTTVNGTKILVRNLSNNFLVTPNRHIRGTILQFVPLLRRNSQSLLLRLQLIRVTNVQIRLRKRRFLRLLRQSDTTRRHVRRGPRNSVRVANLRSLRTIMMLLRDNLSNFPRVTPSPFTNTLNTKTRHPKSGRGSHIFFVKSTRRNGIRLGNTLRRRRNVLENTIRRRLTRLLPIRLKIRQPPRTMIGLFRPLGKQNSPPNQSVLRHYRLYGSLRKVRPRHAPLLFPIIPLIPLYRS